MSASTIALALALGLAAGVLSGLFGVGGGILFVPTLVALGLGQLEAQATSLLAILPTVAAGALSQHRYGNLRLGPAVTLGLASVAGVLLGAAIAFALPEDDPAAALRAPALRRRREARLERVRPRPRYPESP